MYKNRLFVQFYVCAIFSLFIWKQMIYTAPFKFDKTVNLTSKQNIH